MAIPQSMGNETFIRFFPFPFHAKIRTDNVKKEDVTAMRLRYKPWAKDMIADHPNIVISNPEEMKGHWHQLFGNHNPIHIEIGTGKGQFITEMGKRYPHINFIGIEAQSSVIVTALQRLIDDEQPNVRLLHYDAQHITSCFADGEIDRVYLNFSDPWPKNRHEKRRLTYETFLADYEQILVQKGEVHLKTDNQGLFEYSLHSFSKYGMLLKNISLDLHRVASDDNVMTEYEEKFSEKGHRIYRCEAQFKTSL